ncbi:MAG: AtpZ/AtpI family protein [Thermoflexaceae bacterium]|nr:AtpZ/AtpI family protein [Thermoflexaceae bacterium]
MNKKKNFLRNFAMISQLSINILVPTFLCLLAGMWIDAKFETSYWSVILLIIGVLAGGKSAYDTAVNALRMEREEQEKPEDIVARYNSEHGKGVEKNEISEKNKSDVS